MLINIVVSAVTIVVGIATLWDRFVGSKTRLALDRCHQQQQTWRWVTFAVVLVLAVIFVSRYYPGRALPAA